MDILKLRKEKREMWEKCGGKVVRLDIVEKEMPFYFDRGFCDGYREYQGLFDIPKTIAKYASYGKLDFQCSLLKIYDVDDQLLMTSNTLEYANIEGSYPVTAVVVFEDNLVA